MPQKKILLKITFFFLEFPIFLMGHIQDFYKKLMSEQNFVKRFDFFFFFLDSSQNTFLVKSY